MQQDLVKWEEHYKKFRNPDGSIRLPNKHISSLQSDILYHLGLDNVKYDLPKMFGDTKFVCIGGTKHRMRDFAIHMGGVLGIPVGKPVNLTKHSGRYAMYKVGPVISVNHGMGIPSMTILLQEVIKLLYYAKAKDPVIIRIGTSGGLGVPAGSVIVSAWGLNGTNLEKSYDFPVLGKIRRLSAYYDKRLTEELAGFSSENDDFKTIVGGTFTSDDFYRGQGRLDGPVCDYTEQDKLIFLHKIAEMGVRNIEMEATACAAMAREAGIRASAVCVTFLDRLLGDQVTASKATMTEWQKRPMLIVGRYIAKCLDKHW